MKVLVACEFSARVRDAFRARGHDAWSVDLLDTDGDPRWHFKASALKVVGGSWDWDLVIAFPPCTYLTSSNAWRWAEIAPQREEALAFVRALMTCAPRVAVENPTGAIGTQIRKADQYIQPWHFGDPYQKTTGLWLHGLPLLRPEVTTKPAEVQPWCQAGYGPKRANGTRQPGGKVRKVSERNKTFPGIARAMAEQWGNVS